MNKKSLRYLITTVWIINFIFFLGSIFSLLANNDGQLSTLPLVLVGLLFILFIYLIKDTLKLNRPIFIKIIGIVFLISGIYYILIKNIFMVLPVIICGILLLKKD